jgi:hypothetical protein
LRVTHDFYVDRSQRLGKGSSGVVYKGYQLSTNQVIAAKYINNKKLELNDNCKREIEVM